MEEINKKGQMQGMPIAILTIVVAIILLVLGLVIVQSIRDADIVTHALTNTVTNESVSPTDAGVALTGASLPGANTYTVTTVYNDSTGTVIASGNYTVTSAGLLQNLTSEYAATGWNVTYTNYYGDESWISGNESIVGLGDFADFIPIIVLAVVAGLVVAIVLGSMIISRRTR